MDDLMVASWDDLRLEECGDHLDAIVQWGDYLTRRDGLEVYFVLSFSLSYRYIFVLSFSLTGIFLSFFLSYQDHFIPTRVQAARFVAALSQV
jgi:hypothetical protein